MTITVRSCMPGMRPTLRVGRRAMTASFVCVGLAGLGASDAAPVANPPPTAGAAASVSSTTPTPTMTVITATTGTTATAAASIPGGASVLPIVRPASTVMSAPGPAGATAAGAAVAGANVAAPDDVELPPFPNSIEIGRTANAVEQGVLPLGPPDRSLNSDDRVSPVGLPYRGRVRLLQYRHGPDESALLIERHYVDALKAQGFTVLTVCEAPCRTASGLDDESVYWARELDPLHQLGARPYGDRGAYLVGYRHDAVVAVRIGAWELNFGSALKIIQSDTLDLAPLERYAQGSHARSADMTAAKPAARGVQVVPPDVVADAVARSAGVVVVQLTALDKGCGACAKASAAFDALAADATGPRFLRVAYASRSAAGGDAFARTQGVSRVPFFLTFKDGVVVRRQDGAASAAALRAKLLDGVN